MSKLKIKLEVFNSTLVYCVLEQCESITRQKGNKPLEFEASNGVLVGSVRIPFLDSSKIHLRGEYEDYDDRVHVFKFSSQDEAIEVKNKLLEALKEWKDNGYFGKEETNLEGRIFEF